MNRVQLHFNLNFFARGFVAALIFLLVPTLARATADLPQSPVQLSQNETADDNLNNLTELERQAIAEMNRARTNPSAYADWLENIKQYYSGNVLQLPNQPPIRTQEGVQAVDEAIDVLRSLAPLPPLQLSVGMSMAARDHANDMGSKGLVGHYGSDGSQFLDRLNRYGSSDGAVGENISYGVTTARAVVMQMIVDDGVAGRFHRDNILDDEFSRTGIACGSHQRYQQICAIVYSTEYRDRVALNSPSPTVANPTRIGSFPEALSFPDAVSQNNNLPVRTLRSSINTGNITRNSEVISVEVLSEQTELTPNQEPTVTQSNPENPISQLRENTPEESPEEPTVEPSSTEDPMLQLPETAPDASEEGTEETPSPATDIETVPIPEPLPVDLLPQTTEQTILQEEGILADGDSVYEQDGSLYDVYSFEGRSGQEIAIAVESSDFDTFLAVFDDEDTIVGQNDDIDAENTNSYLEIALPRDGTYRIFINGYDANDRGSYTVRVME
ncbi:MAG: CAP domain-containing protein [Cyanobacteriota bacterium]|nr:CAP domain-containing protein [Cyanobacteriota bacterium]